jgi:thioredoxin 2
MTAVRFAKLDTEAHPMAASQHGIRSLPTLVLFIQGKELARCLGARSRQQIIAWVNDSLSKVT